MRGASGDTQSIRAALPCQRGLGDGKGAGDCRARMARGVCFVTEARGRETTLRPDPPGWSAASLRLRGPPRSGPDESNVVDDSDVQSHRTRMRRTTPSHMLQTTRMWLTTQSRMRRTTRLWQMCQTTHMLQTTRMRWTTRMPWTIWTQMQRATGFWQEIQMQLTTRMLQYRPASLRSTVCLRVAPTETVPPACLVLSESIAPARLAPHCSPSPPRFVPPARLALPPLPA